MLRRLKNDYTKFKKIQNHFSLLDKMIKYDISFRNKIKKVSRKSKKYKNLHKEYTRFLKNIDKERELLKISTSRF